MFGMGTGVTSSPWSPGNRSALTRFESRTLKARKKHRTYDKAAYFKALDHLVSLTLAPCNAHSRDLSNR